MTAVAEATSPQEPHHDRDMSRAHWMRSVGTVVMREMAERFFDQLPTEVTEEDIEHIEERSYNIFPDIYGMYYGYDTLLPKETATARAYAIAQHYLTDRSVHDLFPYDDTLQEEFEEHTHFQSPHGTFREGMQAQAIFPINLVYWTAAEAENQGITGFEANSLTDVARILRRPDFQALVDISALTKNGLWQGFSTSISPDHPFADRGAAGKALALNFVDGNVSFDADFKRYLHEEMARINQKGISAPRVQVSGRTTSGCPARWTRPHFTETREDTKSLERLSKDFGKSAEELTDKREPVIITSMNYLAGMLEKADAYYQAHATTRNQ